MADQVTNYQCPACTGPLHFDGKIGKLKCDYCGSTFTVQEIEKLYKAKNESAAAAIWNGQSESIGHADMNHVHHRLMKAGLSQKRSVSSMEKAMGSPG